MDQPTFEKLTGKKLECDQADRFELVVDLSKQQLEGMLGWPLNPDDFESQYVEQGKIKSNLICSCIEDETNLDSADPVVGKYRLYPYFSSDTFIKIDPAVTINAVKLVKGNITYKTFESTDYFPVWKNGNPKFCSSLQVRKDCLWRCNWPLVCPGEYMVAVDADWAFADVVDESTVPLELQKVWAELIAYEYEENKDIKSESITSHSYTKFDRQTVYDRYKSVLDKYAGPLGMLVRPRVVI